MSFKNCVALGVRCFLSLTEVHVKAVQYLITSEYLTSSRLMLAATCRSLFLSGTAVNLQKHCIRDVMTALPLGRGVSYFTSNYLVLFRGQTM